MLIKKLVMGPVEANCYIVANGAGTEGFVIDPGGLNVDAIMQIIEQEQIIVSHILLTHGHFDHILGIDELRKATGAKVCIHELDQNKLTEASHNLSTYMGAGYSFVPAEVILQDGDELQIGELLIKVIHTPGHTPGGVCYQVGNYLFSGDTLFASSIGRTDFPGGSMEQLLASIEEKLLVLPSETIVYPGHNEATTIGQEIQQNPFLA